MDPALRMASFGSTIATPVRPRNDRADGFPRDQRRGARDGGNAARRQHARSSPPPARPLAAAAHLAGRRSQSLTPGAERAARWRSAPVHHPGRGGAPPRSTRAPASPSRRHLRRARVRAAQKPPPRVRLRSGSSRLILLARVRTSSWNRHTPDGCSLRGFPCAVLNPRDQQRRPGRHQNRVVDGRLRLRGEHRTVAERALARDRAARRGPPGASRAPGQGLAAERVGVGEVLAVLAHRDRPPVGAQPVKGEMATGGGHDRRGSGSSA